MELYGIKMWIIKIGVVRIEYYGRRHRFSFAVSVLVTATVHVPVIEFLTWARDITSCL